jgi:hypothetical protein
MTEYTYLDIFATKGIEYMVVIAYFVLLVVFMKALNSVANGNGKQNGKD